MVFCVGWPAPMLGVRSSASPLLPASIPESSVIEQHATMEHSRVSRAALQAGSATVARKCGPAVPSRGLGPAWAYNWSSWAVPQEDLPEDEPDVLC